MPNEARVFLQHLNGGMSPSTSSHTSVQYYKERIRAVRHDNRNLREDIEKSHRENLSLLHENQKLREEIELLRKKTEQQDEKVKGARELAELCERRRQALEDFYHSVTNSKSWRLISCLSGFWHSVIQCFLVGKEK
jgi:predicted RNase H-like nuclease (RuvC/YqgF family)